MSDTSKMSNRALADWCVVEYEAIDPEAHVEYRVDVWIAVRLAREVLRTADYDALRAALERYGWHDDGCKAQNSDKPCSCGFSAALVGEVSDE
jgi:hypothetical protein